MSSLPGNSEYKVKDIIKEEKQDYRSLPKADYHQVVHQPTINFLTGSGSSISKISQAKQVSFRGSVETYSLEQLKELNGA